MTLSQISSIYLLSLPQSIHTVFSFFSNFNKLTESMASSSSSGSNSQCPRRKYDVFLSFRGEDTRNTFTGHLYEGLKNRGIHTFKDDIELKYGDPISEELLTAIEESQVALVVFSKDYATSRWCLEELVRIMECNKKKNGQRVMPVFYNVDPSHVRHQRGSFAEAFAKHESNYKDDVEGMQKVKGWRAALREAANLSGCDTRNRIESDCIRDLVDQISKLCKTSLSYLQNIVGIDTHLNEVNSLLQMEINDVRIIGIWGMGGVGKTTIATAIFHTLSNQFKAACFLEDVKEIAKKKQLFSLQNILLSKLLGKKDDYVNNKHEGKWMIPSRLCSMKVLIVLDDIDQLDHLEYLADDVGWFGNGSRVVVTTRDKRLIEKNDAIIYELTPLPYLEAMQLFNQHAFKGKVPDEFKNLSLEVVNYAKGLPLALVVWGSMLYKRDIDEWTSAIEEMRNNSNSDIDKNLRISYDGLESREQTIFLDIACFFRGDYKKEVMQILESCHLGAKYILNVLIEKSLLFISKNDTIQMHDLIQDMGQNIVKMQKDPGERSRLWDIEEIKEVMINNTGTKTVEAIWTSYCNKGICFSKEAMKNMKMLRILRIGTDNPSTCDDGVIEYLSNNLCWFVWHAYPWKSLPAKFEPKKLVHLELRFSKLCQLWKETKVQQLNSILF
ncbi:TMV resistance protein N-like [Lycium ferocissimum]|uniref:TMV resistance protein N-like n=1 Tax=Lycium ferocissimum TaxID=112874 RepID=UPI002814FE53|nr:TMV resistance protein N-like [Lycium ferocissimum]